MTKYILSRTLRSIFTVVVVFVCVFMLLRLMPLTGYFPEEMLKEADEATRMSYLRNQGLLDHPLVQLWRFIKNLFKGALVMEEPLTVEEYNTLTAAYEIDRAAALAE